MYCESIMKISNTSKHLMTINRVYTYLESCFGQMVSPICKGEYMAQYGLLHIKNVANVQFSLWVIATPSLVNI